MRIISVVCFSLFLTSFLLAQGSLNIDQKAVWGPPGMTALSDGFQYNDIWGYTTPTGEEYGIIGHIDSIFVVDVTDCAAPQRVFGFFGGDTNTTWRDFKTYNGYMYAVCDGCNEGLHVFDMNALPGGTVQHVQTTTSFFVDAHNIYIDEQNARMYAVYGSNSYSDEVVVLDLSNPAFPTLIGNYDLNTEAGVSGGFHIHDLYVNDNIVYASHGYDGYFVYDMNDLNNIILLGSIVTGNYNHSSWVSKDGKYAYYAEEVPTGKPMGIIDLQNLGDPINDISMISTFADPLESGGGLPTPHNPFVKDDLLYISYYEDGIKVYDICDPANPSLFAYYDTYTGNGNNYFGYDGCWGIYPFFDSGCIIASDMFTGMNTFKLEADCTDTNPFVTGNIPDDTKIFSTDLITSNGFVDPIEQVLFQAPNNILLQNDFEVKVGATFRAEIGPCNFLALPPVASEDTNK